MPARRRLVGSSPSPHRLDPLIAAASRLAPYLSEGTTRRIAEMALAMREATENFGAAQAAHLVAAGFLPAEIRAGHEVAAAVLRSLDLPEEALAPWSSEDTARLRDAALRARRHRSVLALAA